MIRAYRSELVKLLRRRVIALSAITSIVFAIGGALVVLSSAEPEGRSIAARALSLEDLARAGGGSEIFRTAASFAGTLFFVVFVGVIAAEFSRGTIRTMLLRQPRRVPLLLGKLAAMLTFAAAGLAATEIMTWVAARVLAPGYGVSTSAWTSLDALGAGLVDFGALFVWVTGYAVLGMVVAVLLRSVPLALAVGIAWAGPLEHLTQNAWPTASRVFPGLLLEAFVAGGTPDVSAGRALAIIAVYATVAALIGAAVFARRDVTA